VGILTRRAVLALAGGTVLTGLVGASAAGRTGGRSARLHRSRFVHLVGARFDLEAAGVRSAARLESVDDLVAGEVGDDLAYSLLFRPLTGPEPVSGIRLLRAPGLSRVPLFLEPVDRGSARRLQAVINQRIPR
jgi:hypothetical protein